MIPKAHLVHESAGRLRVRIPSKKNDAAYLQSLRDRFRGMTGISAVHVNPSIGSALFLHSVEGSVIMQYAREQQLFDVTAEPELRPTDLYRAVRELFRGADRQVRDVTRGAFDLGSATVLALVAAGAVQILRGGAGALPWYAAFWYALNIFMKASGEQGDGA